MYEGSSVHEYEESVRLMIRVYSPGIEKTGEERDFEMGYSVVKMQGE